jgi:hypothetical protein
MGGQLSLSPAKYPSLSTQPLPQRLGLAVWVIAQKSNYGPPGARAGPNAISLPRSIAVRRDPYQHSCVTLKEAQLEAPLSQVLAEGPGLIRKILWFQCPKTYRRPWQKGNAEMPLRPRL